MRFLIDRWVEGLIILVFLVYLLAKYSLQLRNLFGIGLDRRTKVKTDLEIEKLGKEAESRDSRITTASVDDIRRYDRKVRDLEMIILSPGKKEQEMQFQIKLPWVALVIAIVMTAYALLGRPESFRRPVLFGLVLVAVALLIDQYMSRKRF